MSVPKLLLLVVTCRLRKFTWFITLKASARNWIFRDRDSFRPNSFRTDVSQIYRPGPRIVPTPATPRAVVGAVLNAAVLNMPL